MSDELIPTQKPANNPETMDQSRDQSISLTVPQNTQLTNKKSVHFLTTATSTTTLPNPDTPRRLRPELNTLLLVLIKQNQSEIKATHHIEILQEAVPTRNPPQGLRPRINPRIPDNKQIDFLIEWNQVTTEAAICYTKLLLKHWEIVLRSSSELRILNIKNIETRINNQGANTEEWKKIKDTIEKVRQRTIEDLEKKQDRRPFQTQN